MMSCSCIYLFEYEVLLCQGILYYYLQILLVRVLQNVNTKTLEELFKCRTCDC